MRIRKTTTLISGSVLSICLLTFIPVGLKFASTWKELYFEGNGFKEQNYLVLIGCSSLGFVLIGLVVLWTGYRKQDRWAWLVLLIIILLFVFPGNVLPPLLISAQNGGGVEWSYWLGVKWWRDPLGMKFALGFINFVIMLLALLLPIRAFWGGASNSNRTKMGHDQDNNPVASPK